MYAQIINTAEIQLLSFFVRTANDGYWKLPSTLLQWLITVSLIWLFGSVSHLEAEIQLTAPAFSQKLTDNFHGNSWQ